MKNINPIFNTDKERNDFFLALLVLLFFAWLIYWFGFRNTLSKSASAANLLPTTETVEQHPFLNRKASEENAITKTRKPIEEDMPKVIADTLAIKWKDTDEDGVADKRDNCPLVAGPITNKGCPLDSDGDGINNQDDRCPQLAGVVANNGCPADTDKDNVYDKHDRCPRLPGVAANFGCPPDSDGDGLHDKIDNCPNRAGLAALNGCPEVKVDEAERKVISEEIKSLEFETAKAILKGHSTAILDKVANILNKYPDYKLDITGHTDNVGQAAANLLLSQQRAKACYDYLVNKNIDRKRLLSKGMGETQPIDTNDTRTGRQNNRRVVFELHY